MSIEHRPSILLKTRNDWVVARQGGIGGSDAAAILGLSPWRTAIDVYLDKVGKPIERTSPAMEWGQLLEPVIRNYYARRENIEIETFENRIFIHPRYDWMRASIDGYIPVRRAVLEIKTGRSAEKDKWDPIPPYYYAQVQHYLEVLGLDEAHVVALIDGSEVLTRFVRRDQAFIDRLLEAEYRFWHEHVLRRMPPEAKSYDDVCALYPSLQAGKSKIATDDIIKDLREYKQLQQQLKDLEKRAEEIKARVCAYLGDADTLTDEYGQVLVTHKEYQGALRVDQSRLFEKYPEIANDPEICKPGVSFRRFMLKKVPTPDLDFVP